MKNVHVKQINKYIQYVIVKNIKYVMFIFMLQLYKIQCKNCPTSWYVCKDNLYCQVKSNSI